MSRPIASDDEDDPILLLSSPRSEKRRESQRFFAKSQAYSRDSVSEDDLAQLPRQLRYGADDLLEDGREPVGRGHDGLGPYGYDEDDEGAEIGSVQNLINGNDRGHYGGDNDSYGDEMDEREDEDDEINDGGENDDTEDELDGSEAEHDGAEIGSDHSDYNNAADDYEIDIEEVEIAIDDENGQDNEGNDNEDEGNENDDVVDIDIYGVYDGDRSEGGAEIHETDEEGEIDDDENDDENDNDNDNEVDNSDNSDNSDRDRLEDIETVHQARGATPTADAETSHAPQTPQSVDPHTDFLKNILIDSPPLPSPPQISTPFGLNWSESGSDDEPLEPPVLDSDLREKGRLEQSTKIKQEQGDYDRDVPEAPQDVRSQLISLDSGPRTGPIVSDGSPPLRNPKRSRESTGSGRGRDTERQFPSPKRPRLDTPPLVAPESPTTPQSADSSRSARSLVFQRIKDSIERIKNRRRLPSSPPSHSINPPVPPSPAIWTQHHWTKLQSLIGRLQLESEGDLDKLPDLPEDILYQFPRFSTLEVSGRALALARHKRRVLDTPKGANERR